MVKLFLQKFNILIKKIFSILEYKLIGCNKN